ncbi:MAG: (2Fe-2S)-binding protein [Planctomycetales bacterium]|nr:(2Fe-2S)-binding protein [Planctomycetales bacterium]
MSDSQRRVGVSRRAFLQGTSAVAAASALHQQAPTAGAQEQSGEVIRGKSVVTLDVNGVKRKVSVEPRTTLLETLRYQLDLTGAKPVSGDGSSGASTVLVDGKPVMASTTLTITCHNKSITTAEGLSDDPIPAAFVRHDAQQCGFCTPGFVVAIKAFLQKHPNATEDEIRKSLNGNICRCGTYANIIDAVVDLAKGGANG